MARLVQTLALFLLLLTQVSAVTTYYLSIVDRTNKQLLTNPSVAASAPRRAVQLSSFAWSSIRSIDSATGQASGKLKSTFLTVNRTADANSALIVEQEINNAILKTVVITGYAPNQEGIQVAQETITLTNALVTTFTQGPISGSGILQESIAFSFQKFQLKTGVNTATFDSIVVA